MKGCVSHRRVRLAVIVGIMLLGPGLLVATGPGSGGPVVAFATTAKADPRRPLAPYPLFGDTANVPGTTTTVFTTTGGTLSGAWSFGTSAAQASALEGTCVAVGCIGVRGDGILDGVAGLTHGGNGAAVYGDTHTATAAGLAGYNLNGPGDPTINSYGIFGEADTTDHGVGVYGAGAGQGNGVYGVVGDVRTGSAAATGVGGFGATGVLGAAQDVNGLPNGGIGVEGDTADGTGVNGVASGNGNGVVGSAFGPGYAGYFDGNVFVGGTITCTTPPCAATVVNTTSGRRVTYGADSTQAIVSDEGTGTLVNGRAVITIDPLFAQAVDLAHDYQVFVTPRSADTAGLAVVNQGTASFEVRELNKGQGNFRFSWRIDALRSGAGATRMGAAPPPPKAPARRDPKANTLAPRPSQPGRAQP